MQLIARAFTCALLAGSTMALGQGADAQTLRDKIRSHVMETRDAHTGPMMRAQQRGGAGQGHLPGVQKAQAPEGAVKVSIEVGGNPRSFFLYKPEGFRHDGAAVLGLHGGGGSAAHLMSKASLPRLAAERGFLAVFPDGIDGNWNDGREIFADRPDDVAFMRALVDWLVVNEGIDRGRVFATGSSNGGTMAQRLACDAADLVAGITTISANLPDALYSICDPVQSTAVLMINGTDDPLMPYWGGTPEIPGREPSGAVLSSLDTAAFWADVAICGRRLEPRDAPDRVDDGTTVTAFAYDCRYDQVILLRINGGGHGVPGGEPAQGIQARLTGPTSQEIDAFALALSFSEQHDS